MVLGISETAILVIVVIVVFGAKKLPELARSAGQSARILKSEVKAMKSDRSPAQSTSEPHIIKHTDSGTPFTGNDNVPRGGTSR